MKKFITLAVLIMMVLSGCEEPGGDNVTTQLPNLIIKNESSFVLTNVVFSGISFTADGTNELSPLSPAVSKPLKESDLNKSGYITFVRKDIGIALKTEAISINDQDYSFTFLDSTVVEEQGNSSNKRSLAQISFLSQVTVQRGGLTVSKSDNINFGESLIDVQKQNDFTIKNTGVGKLLFEGIEPVKIIGDSDGVFSVVQPSSSEIAPDGSLSFIINFTPKAAQSYSATVTIKTNDQNGDFGFSITAAGVSPKPIAEIFYGEIEISQNGIIDAGEVLITQSKNITITLKNSGSALLTINTASISINGTDASVFTKLGDPSGNISVGDSSTFDIKCEPIKEGDNNAILRIPTDDESRSTIEIYLRVTGVRGAAVLELIQSSVIIENNSLFIFGRVEIGTFQTRTFTIKNTGNINLNLPAAPNPVVSSSNPVFVVQLQPANRVLTPDSSTTFIIRLLPSAEAEVSSLINIENDSEDGLFSFNINGTGYVKRPQIEIIYNDVSIAQNNTIDAGDILITQAKDISVIIRNTGEALLNIDTSDITITGTDSSAFTKITNPAANISVGEESSFIIKCEPVVEGENTAILTIPSDDINRNPVIINLKTIGHKGASIFELSQGAAVIANNSLTPFDMGQVLLGGNTSITFKIRNTGNIPLELTGTPFIESSSDLFVIPVQPTNTVLNPAYDTTFTVLYTPTEEQTDTAFITILNNSKNSVYTLNLKATGYTATAD